MNTRLFLFIVNIFSLLVSTTVIIGWYTHNSLLVQLRPQLVPMQFNTALCFLLLSISSLLVRTKQIKLAATLSGFCLSVALVTVSQDIFTTNLGIDTFFVEPFNITKTVHPGRMAINTAFAFFLSLGFFSMVLQINWKTNLIY